MNGLRVSNAWVTNSVGQKLICGVNLNCGKGETLTLFGTSGAGKSTLLKLIAGCLPPGFIFHKGEIWDGDLKVSALVPKDRQQWRKRRVGMVFQDPAHWDPLIRVRSQVIEIYRLHNPEQSEAAFESRLDSEFALLKIPIRVANQFPHQVSGGEKQRVSLLIALAGRPAWLLLDEPTSALDPEATEVFTQNVKSVQQEWGCGVIWVTHDLTRSSVMGASTYYLEHGNEVSGIAFQQAWDRILNP